MKNKKVVKNESSSSSGKKASKLKPETDIDDKKRVYEITENNILSKESLIFKSQ